MNHLQRHLEKYVFAIALIILITTSLISIFGVSREYWFDESFSLETVHMMNGGEKIVWQEHDVHPPVYYKLLAGWMALEPYKVAYEVPYERVNPLRTYESGWFGNMWLDESEWARLLSLLIAVVFFVGAYKALSNIYGESGASFAMLFMSICSIYIHFATETRMYILVLAFSAWALYCFTKVQEQISAGNSAYGWLAAGTIICGLSVFTHYYSAIMLPFFFMFLLLTLWRKEDLKNLFVHLGVMTIIGIGFVLSAFMIYAAPQLERGEGMWFQPPALSSLPSAISYAFVNPDYIPFMDTMSVLFIVFMAWLIWFAYLQVRKVWKGGMQQEEKATFAFFLAILYPFFVLGILPLLGDGEGFTNLYHHRFFLCITWLIAASWFVSLHRLVVSRHKIATLVMGLVTVSLGFMLLMMWVYAPYELKHTFEYIPCGGVTVMHESPFSALPAIIYDRERSCYNRHVISTQLSKSRRNTAGYDAFADENVFVNMQLPLGELYYVRAQGKIVFDDDVFVWNGESLEGTLMTVIYQDDGVGLVKFNSTGNETYTLKSYDSIVGYRLVN